MKSQTIVMYKIVNMIDIRNLSDQEIVNAILCRDTFITKEYLYKKCYPLFKAIFDKYYTDCENYIEFVNQIYVLITTPGKETGKSPLSSFGFRCTLTLWLKLVAENYCKKLYKKRIEIVNTDISSRTDSFGIKENSIGIDLSTINSSDVEIILHQIENERYRSIIKLRYVDCKTNEETAEILHMTMANYYNKHKIAKAQFLDALIKEGLL